MRMEGKIGYIYLGDGTKVAAKLDSTLSVSSYGEEGLCGMRYRGSFVYDVTVNGIQRLQSISVSTGRLVALTGTNGSLSFEHDGFVTDHLGNVAAVVNLSASPGTSTQNLILEQNDYTPFGMRLEPAAKTQAANRWRYAGKEEQRIAGMDLHLIDFGARFYDPFTCRWSATDPLAHKYFSMSPYNYCGNDPVNFFDPDGRDALIRIRRNTIIVSATIYTNSSSKKSADQAARFWNNRTGDNYQGKSIKYEITVIDCGNLLKNESDSDKSRFNTYEVNSKKVDEKYNLELYGPSVGITADNIHTIVKKEYSETLPNSRKPSTTGAHEIGHILGIDSHSERGIMSPCQDKNRTSEVTSTNIQEMMTSKNNTINKGLIRKLIESYDEWINK